MKLKGKVIKGEGLGYKTANLKVEKPFVLADGVYLAKVVYQNQIYPSIAIMGVRKDIEIYLLDFNGDLYNQVLEVEIFEKMRDLIYCEKDELLEQIQIDIKKAKEYFNNVDITDTH